MATATAYPLIGQGLASDVERYSFGVAANWTRGPHELDIRLDPYRLQQKIDCFADYDSNPVRISDRRYTGEPVEERGVSANVTHRYDNTAWGNLEINAYSAGIDRSSAL